MERPYDLVVRGGLIYDGTGGEAFEGDVAVKDGKVAAVGQVSGAGAE
jgi:N-acyl-D-aspartate/D-glutamate deacylase